MKRLIYAILAVMILIGIASPVFALDSYFYDYEINASDEFRAVGVVIYETNNPTDYLQNQMDFEFVDGIEITRFYSHDEAVNERNEAWSNSIELNLVYDRARLENKEQYFISGTFTYTFSSPDDSYIINGDVRGSIAGFGADESIFDFSNPQENIFVLLLECFGTDANWVQGFPLVTPNSGFIQTASPTTSNDTEVYLKTDNTTDNTYVYNEAFFSHEEHAHIPSPYNQADVAAGVGITTVGIVVVNALTNTSIFGSAPFNSSFNPQAPQPVQPVGVESASQTASAAGGGGFIKSVGNFFKGLFEALRDMLTDEGRSFASGKVTDVLQDSDMSD